MEKHKNYWLPINGLILIIFLGGCTQTRQIAKQDSEVDVIIVGAGMAGLTAAKELLKAGKSFLVLEAQNRIGGRTLVDKKFAVPVDLGAAWFHGVERNPLVPIADKMGFKRVDTDLNGPIFVGSRKASQKETEACEKTYDEMESAILRQVRMKKDVPISALLPKGKPCSDLVASNIGPLENGAEIDKVSSITAGLFDSGNDDFIREGLGTFVEAFGKNVPVRLNSVVNKIQYGPTGVKVSLVTGEKFYARRVLITVSTGVLQSEKIAFDPPLPQWKKKAIEQLPMGLLNKVVMQFKKDIFKDTPQNSWVLWDGPGNDNVAFVIRPFNAPMAIAFYGGEQAKAFERDDNAALKHAKDTLRFIYGESVERELELTEVTKWGHNPWTLGSYSYVKPGASATYQELLKPVEERVFFAGEACAIPEFNGSVHGAYDSSLKASRFIVESLSQ